MRLDNCVATLGNLGVTLGSYGAGVENYGVAFHNCGVSPNNQITAFGKSCVSFYNRGVDVGICGVALGSRGEAP